MRMLLLLALPGRAAEGFDGHHLKPTPSPGAPLDLVATWRPSDARGPTLAVSGLVERSDGALVRVVRDWDGVTEQSLLDDLVTLNLGVLAGWGPRVALGDLRLAAPVGLRVPRGGGLGLALVPFLDLPTGDEALLLGAPGLSGGGLLAAGLHGRRATVDANLGLDSGARQPWLNQPAGARLLGGLGGAYAPREWIGLRLEATYRTAAATGLRPDQASPAELLLSAGGVASGDLRWTVGGAAGLTQGAGAARFRGYAGLTYALGPDEGGDADLDGVIDALDACVREPEVRNGYADADGCPDALAGWTLFVIDHEGQPVVGAEVRVDQQVLAADGAGLVRLEGRVPGAALTGTVRGAGYQVGAFHTPPLPEGESAATVRLAWLPGTTRFLILDPAGAPLDAAVTLTGPGTQLTAAPDAAGVLQIVLNPGHWSVEVSAPGHTASRFGLDISHERADLNRVEVTLFPPEPAR